MECWTPKLSCSEPLTGLQYRHSEHVLIMGTSRTSKELQYLCLFISYIVAVFKSCGGSIPIFSQGTFLHIKNLIAVENTS